MSKKPQASKSDQGTKKESGKDEDTTSATSETDKSDHKSGADAKPPASAATRAGDKSAASTPPSAAMAAASRKKGGGLGWLLLIILLAGVGGGAWYIDRINGWPHVWWTYVDPYLPKPENPERDSLLARVAVIEEKIADISNGGDGDGGGDAAMSAALQQVREDLSTGRAGIIERLETVEKSLESMKRTAGSVSGDDVQALSQDALQSLSDRLAALESGPAGGSADVSGILGRLAALESQAGALEKSLSDDRAALASVRTSMDGVSLPGGGHNAAALVLSVAQLRDAVGRGVAYTQELDAVSAMAAGLAGASESLVILRDHAPTGVMTLSQLRGAFKPAASAAMDAAVDADVADSWMEQTLHQLKNVVRIRKTGGETAPGSVASVILRAQDSLQTGDLTGALSALGNLEGPAAGALDGWVQSAQARNRVDGALASLHTLAVRHVVAAQE